MKMPSELKTAIRIENVIGYSALIPSNTNDFRYTSSKVKECELLFGNPIYINDTDEYKTKTYRATINGCTGYIRTAKGFGTSYEVPFLANIDYCIKFLDGFKELCLKLYKEGNKNE